jgi:hopene-associated glycosyltransferase HpnB
MLSVTGVTTLSVEQFVEYVDLFLRRPAEGAASGTGGSEARSRVTTEILAATALAVWLYLLLARGSFWRCTERADCTPAKPAEWPSVALVVPARNEAAHIAESLRSLAGQDYAGPCSIIVVDDESSDGTADIARRTLAGAVSERVHLVTGRPLPAGWTGKLWAVKQGIDAAMPLPHRPHYLLLTDADIVHPADCVSALVARAQAGGLVLTSLMVRLRCESFAERVCIPAFLFFFQMLYPFSWVNDPHAPVAAAAGGCMLVRADALAAAGGIEAIRGALIDDCALARLLKLQGPIWLALSTRVRSLRAYDTFAAIGGMVARSAYAQLRYSPLLLLGTVAGMAVTYVAPPIIAISGSGPARALALATWGLMAIAFVPTLRLYQRSPMWGLALPAIALLYIAFTLDSAYQYVRGRGGTWKGRAQANVSAS